MSMSFKPLVGLSLALAAGFASATTIGFGGLSNKALTGDYQENGYELSSGSDDMFAFGKPKELAATDFTFASASGAAFDLKSFDLNFLNADNIAFSYTLADGTSWSGTLDDNKNNFYKFDLDDLTSFSLSGTETTGKGRHATTSPAYFSMDDIKVSAYQAASAVPEPTSIALLLAGIAMIGTMSRRRRV